MKHYFRSEISDAYYCYNILFVLLTVLKLFNYGRFSTDKQYINKNPSLNSAEIDWNVTNLGAQTM